VSKVKNEEIKVALDKIGEQTTLTRIDVGKIEEHLKTLNGKVSKNEIKIDELRKFDYRLGIKVAGLASILSLIISLLVSKLVCVGSVC